MSPKTNLKSDLITGIARKNSPRNHLPSELDIGYNGFGPKSDLEKCELLMAVAENRKNQNNALKTSVINNLKN